MTGKTVMLNLNEIVAMRTMLRLTLVERVLEALAGMRRGSPSDVEIAQVMLSHNDSFRAIDTPFLLAEHRAKREEKEMPGVAIGIGLSPLVLENCRKLVRKPYGLQHFPRTPQNVAAEVLSMIEQHRPALEEALSAPLPTEAIQGIIAAGVIDPKFAN